MPERPAGYDNVENYEVSLHPAQLLRRAHQRGTQLFNQGVTTQNLTAAQFAMMAALLRNGPMPQNQLGRRLSMDPSTTSTVVRKLTTDNFLTNDRSPLDMRASLIALTDKGRACVEQHIPLSIRVGQELLSPLTPGERGLFLELLQKIVANDLPQSSDEARSA